LTTFPASAGCFALCGPRSSWFFETEIWPNLYREARRSGARLMIANGGSPIAVRNAIAAWRGSSLPFSRSACHLRPERIDRERYAATGAPPDLVRVGGNLKYDFTPREDIAPEIQGFLKRIEPSAIFIAASTMPPL